MGTMIQRYKLDEDGYRGVRLEEIARDAGVSKGTVKSATSRGLSTLARILKEEAE